MRGIAALVVLAPALACGGPEAPLYPAGSARDDGHGDLALASMQLLTPPDGGPPDAHLSDDDDELSPDLDRAPSAAAGSFGGDAYGGSTYAGHVVPDWRSVPVERRPRYRPAAGLSGAIEGVVRWRSPAPAKLAAPCGTLEPLALGPDRALEGVLVYIEKVSVGRPLSAEGKPASVGGLAVKRGCALVPVVQVAAPLPSPLIVHGDAARGKLRVTSPSGAARTYELREAGKVSLQVQHAGVTRLDAADGTFASAWVIGLDSPYYALTDDRGRYRLDELAAGTYEVTFWQPPLPALASGAVTYGPPIVAKRTVRVDAARPARLDVDLGAGP